MTLEDYKKLSREEQRKKYIELSEEDKIILKYLNIPKARVVGKMKITRDEKQTARKNIKDYKKIFSKNAD